MAARTITTAQFRRLREILRQAKRMYERTDKLIQEACEITGEDPLESFTFDAIVCNSVEDPRKLIAKIGIRVARKNSPKLE